ncbi:MAG TPA: helix-turn-helix domain-containing protein [Phycisphaerales bacterium]|nr:helix-turn-helix domain-containing protein [Phycisphaerales bacterium]
MHGENGKDRKPAPEPLLVSERAAGVALGVSARSVFNLLARGDLTAVRIGKRKLVTVASIRAFIERAGTPEGGAA